MFQLPGGDGDDHEEDFEGEAPPMPAWFGPPEDELGGVIPLDLVIGRSEDGVVALPHVTVYSTGVAFEFIAVARGLSNANSNGVLQEQHWPEEGKEPPPRFLRLGLELPGGERVSNLGGKVHRRRFLKPDEKPDGAVFFEHGGRGGAGGGGRVRMQPGYWLWPLPERGTIRVFCEWPVVEIPLSVVEIESSEFPAAAERVVRL